VAAHTSRALDSPAVGKCRAFAKSCNRLTLDACRDKPIPLCRRLARRERSERSAQKEIPKTGTHRTISPQNACNTSSPFATLIKRRRSLHLDAVRLCCPLPRGQPAVLGGCVSLRTTIHRARDRAHHLGSLVITPLTPCCSRFYPQPTCFQDFAHRTVSILLKTRILGGGGGGVPSPPDIPILGTL